MWEPTEEGEEKGHTEIRKTDSRLYINEVTCVRRLHAKRKTQDLQSAGKVRVREIIGTSIRQRRACKHDSMKGAKEGLTGKTFGCMDILNGDVAFFRE